MRLWARVPEFINKMAWAFSERIEAAERLVVRAYRLLVSNTGGRNRSQNGYMLG